MSPTVAAPVRTAEVDTDPPKPRARGWIHEVAFFVSLVTGVVLVSVAPTARDRLASAVYALSASALFGTSALYHRRTWSVPARRVMKRLDHSMIYLLIAGTYTPFALLTMSRTAGYVVLAVVWAGALAGIVAQMARVGSPRWLSAPLYIALGWVAVFVLPDILHNGGVAMLTLLLVGGAAYSVGAVCYALRRPEPVPGVFGYHEVFHACTAFAATCHYVAVSLAVYS